MKTCKKLRCIANVHGRCTVETCRGEIRSTGRKLTDTKDSAKLYLCAASMFGKDKRTKGEMKHE